MESERTNKISKEEFMKNQYQLKF